MATVFIIEWDGCECGGACDVAFSTREKAQAWIDERESKDSYPRIVDYYEIKEVVIQ